LTVLPPRSPLAHPCLRSTASLVLCRRSTPCRRARGSYRSSLSPTDPPLSSGGWPQGLSVLAREVSMHAWGLPPRSARDALAICRAPQYCLPVCLIPSPLVLAISEFTTSGYPAYMCPCPTLLSCMILSFTTSRRFIPTLFRLSARATSFCSAMQ